MWELYGLFAGIIFSISILIRKSLFLKKLNFNDVIFFYFLGALIANIIMVFSFCPSYKSLKQFDNKTIILGIFAGLIVVFGAYFKTRAYYLVNNVGYAEIFEIIVKMIILLLASLYLFNISCNKMTLIGVILALIGVFLIIKYQ
jgi:hypothetical protein